MYIDFEKFIQKYGNVNGSIIDVGCGNGDQLFVFGGYGYNKLIGIEKHRNGHNYQFNYYNIRLRQNHPPIQIPPEQEEYRRMIEAEFRERCSFHHVDILDYNYEDNKYCGVVLHLILHFIDHVKQKVLIERLHNQMEPGGLMFIKINHNQHPDILKGNAVEGPPNVFTGKTNPKEIRYYVDETEFVSYINSKYKLIPEGGFWKTKQILGFIIQKQ